LDKRFVRIVSHTTERGWGALTSQAGALNDQAREAGEKLRPAAEKAIRAITNHPVQFGTEAAHAGVEATRQTAGRLLNAVAGVLQGAGDALAGRERSEEDTPKS
jgi:hypothetical protein